LEKGYLGESADPKPNEDYTVAGVTKHPEDHAEEN
jgi:hypothetical protein